MTLARPSGRALDPLVAQAERQIAADAGRPISQAVLDRAAVQGMLAALDDRWASYYSPSAYRQFQGMLAGHYSGVGIWVGRDALGVVRVVSVQPGSPAAGQAVAVGDVLIAVAGEPVAGRSIADIVAGLRGDPGTKVVLLMERSGVTRRVTLLRAPVMDDDVWARQLTPGVELLRITAFTGGVGRWVRDQIASAHAHHVSGIVLDLRDNPGGLLDEAVETASVFLDGGPVVSYVHRGSPPQVLDALGVGDTSIPLVVLVDGGTASAAEIVAGALQDRGRAVIVGSRTFGKGSIQRPTELPDGSGFEVTVGQYLTPSGRALDGVGIEPDVEVAGSAAPGVAEQRAVQVLSGMVADTGSSGGG